MPVNLQVVLIEVDFQSYELVLCKWISLRGKVSPGARPHDFLDLHDVEEFNICFAHLEELGLVCQLIFAYLTVDPVWSKLVGLDVFDDRVTIYPQLIILVLQEYLLIVVDE